MGEKMTLAGVAADLHRLGMHGYAQIIDAHLTQPAQAVDVGAIREVIAELSNPSVLHAPYVTRCADKLTAALPNVNGKDTPMLPDEVRKAVEYVDQIFDDADNGEWATIKAHLLAREAEVERLQNIADGNAELYQHELLRTARADALLRACRQMLPDYCGELEASITTHLSENSRVP